MILLNEKKDRVPLDQEIASVQEAIQPSRRLQLKALSAIGMPPKKLIRHFFYPTLYLKTILVEMKKSCL